MQDNTRDAMQEQFIITGSAELLVDDDMSAEMRGRYNFQRMMHAFFFHVPRALLQPLQAG
jgi:hypothetical protein